MSVDALVRPCAPQDARHAQSVTERVTTYAPSVPSVTLTAPAMPQLSNRNVADRIDLHWVSSAHPDFHKTSHLAALGAVPADEPLTRRTGGESTGLAAVPDGRSVNAKTLADDDNPDLAGTAPRESWATGEPGPGVMATAICTQADGLAQHLILRRLASRDSSRRCRQRRAELIDICSNDVALAAGSGRVAGPQTPSPLKGVVHVAVEAAELEDFTTGDLALAYRPHSSAKGAM